MRHLPDDEARRLAEVGLLSATLVHELRQPLFAARAMAQLAQAAARPEQVAAHLDGVLAQLQTVEALLRGYSDVSRHPGGVPVVFDVWSAVRGAHAVVEHRAGVAGVAIALGGAPAAVARAPVLAVQQVLVNLVQNAVDALAGQPGGVVSVTVLEGPVRVRVADNGPGIDPAIRARLFEPFRTTKPTGTGLGLSLSRDLVVGFGGELRLVDSGSGTVWELGFPG